MSSNQPKVSQLQTANNMAVIAPIIIIIPRTPPSRPLHDHTVFKMQLVLYLAPPCYVPPVYPLHHHFLPPLFLDVR
jgi:hypothetical protein